MFVASGSAHAKPLSKFLGLGVSYFFFQDVFQAGRIGDPSLIAHSVRVLHVTWGRCYSETIFSLKALCETSNDRIC